MTPHAVHSRTPVSAQRRPGQPPAKMLEQRPGSGVQPAPTMAGRCGLSGMRSENLKLLLQDVAVLGGPMRKRTRADFAPDLTRACLTQKPGGRVCGFATGDTFLRVGAAQTRCLPQTLCRRFGPWLGGWRTLERRCHAPCTRSSSRPCPTDSSGPPQRRCISLG